MATREELEQKINKLEVNMNRTDRIVNGGEDEDVLIDGGQLVPSIRKWQKELGEEYGFPQELVQQAEDAADRAENATDRVLEVPTYTSGLEITSYNQLIRDSNGEFWRVSGQVDLPYVTTGTGIPEDDALVPAGDSALRQDLVDPDKGAAMVAMSDGTDVARRIASQASISSANIDASGDSGAAAENSAQLRDILASAGYRFVETSGPARLIADIDMGEFRQQGFPYYTAVPIDRDNVSFGPAYLRSKGRGGPGTFVEPLLATPRDRDAGERRNITFNGTVFDLGDDGVTPTNQRGLHLTCTDDIRMIGTMAQTTGARRGYMQHLDNCRNVVKVGHLHSKVTGGDNYRYVDGLAKSGCLYSNFSEAIDFDGVANSVAMSALVFKSSNAERDDQCIDLNSVQNASISGLSARHTGNVWYINYKETTQPNYQDFLDNLPPSSRTPSKNIVIQGVTAEGCGNAANPAGIINTTFTVAHPEGPNKRIIIANHVYEDSGALSVAGGEDIVFDNVIQHNVLAPASDSFGALSIRQDEVSAPGVAHPVQATIRNHSINGCPRSGLKVSGCERLDIDGLRVRNADQLGLGNRPVDIIAIPSGAQYTIDRLDVDGDVRIIGPDDATIIWGSRNRVSGDLIFANAAHKSIRGQTETISFGDVAATGSVRKCWTTTRRCRVTMGYIVSATTVAVNGADFRSFVSRSIKSGVRATVTSFSSSSTALPENSLVEFNYPAASSALLLERGDSIEIETASSGGGVALSDLRAVIEVAYL